MVRQYVGWCWKKVIPLLQASGHAVFVPTLTGLGERSHLLHSGINLSTHIQDIVHVLEYEDLRDVIIVGHSYGGMVIAGVADQVPERVAQLVYLDAFAPEVGMSVIDFAPNPLRDELVMTQGDGWRQSWDLLGASDAPFGVTDGQDVAWILSRLGDQPFGTFTEPSQTSAWPSKLQRVTNIQLTGAPFFTEAAARLKRQGAASYEIRDAGHDAMVTRPDALAAILLEVARAL